MRIIKWTKEEDEILLKNYSKKTKKELLELLPNRKYTSIIIRAGKFKLKKERNEYVESKLDILLEDTPQSFYWVGFLLADGCISKTSRLQLTLAGKDKEHVEKFGDYINCKVKEVEKGRFGKYYCIKAQDKFICPKIQKKFDWKDRKTYNPPEIDYSKFNDDLFLSLLIGFIDGDGTIKKQYKRKDSLIGIKIHSNWLKILINWCENLQKISGVKIKLPKIRNHGYCQWNIANNLCQVFLKRKAKELRLPILNRKWDKIDENFQSRMIQSELIVRKVFNKFKNKEQVKNIIKELDITESNCYRIIRNIKEGRYEQYLLY